MNSSGRFLRVGDSPYPWEREAIDVAFAAMPDADPFHARALVDLLDPSTGSLYEIDLLVIGFSAIYLVEIKSHPGRIAGDEVDWTWTSPEGVTRHMTNPLRLANHKAKVLRGLMERDLRKKNQEKVPWIQPLIFLSADGLELDLSPAGQVAVVTRNTLARALRFHNFPGASQAHDTTRLTITRARALRQSFDHLGLRPRKDRLHVGPYELGSLLHESRSYQDREAVHREIAGMRRRARTYLVPGQTSQEARLKCRREADRDAQLLWDVREHPGILRLTEYVADAALGPTLLFDPFEGGVALPDLLRRHKLDFSQRRSIVEQVGLALAYCHRREVYHGGLAPEAVLVRPGSDGEPPEVRLWNFQFGHSIEVSPTLHRSNLSSEPAAAYQAPELFNNPAGHAVATDLFSLGALAFYLFTGHAPAQDGIDLQQRLDRDGFLDPRTVADNIPENVADAVVQATQLARADRGDDVDAWLEQIRVRPPAARVVSPLEAQRGDDLGEGLRVEAVLGQGASARVLHVVRDGQNFALKVSLGPDHDERLLAEGALLKRLRHSRIVAYHDPPLVLADRVCLLLALAGQRTLQHAITEEGSIDLDLAFRYGDDLLSALVYLEDQGVPHRDIKPANLGEGSAQKQTKHLTLFDFSLAQAEPTNLRAGTEVYSDPFLSRRGRWDTAADRWSAALTLHELLTGARPTWSPRGASPLEPGASLVLARERFDPAARDRLTVFFKRALAVDIGDRFPDAQAMLAAWNQLAEAPRPSARSDAPGPTPDEQRATLAGISDDSPIEALPLSARARNALDRAGLVRAVELLGLPANRLTAIRGAGSKVADEINDLRKLWSPLRPAPAALLFFPHYRGRDLPVDAADLPTLTAQALAYAGLPGLATVAGAPAAQIEKLAQRHGFDLAALHRAMQVLHDSADAREHPSSAQAWIDALLRAPDRKDSTFVHVRRWLGLDPPFEGRPGASVREVAAAGNVKTTAAIYLAITRAREHAHAHPALADLIELAEASVDDAAVPLERAAETLAAHLGEPAGDPARLTRCAALLRWSSELSESIVVERLRDDLPALWVSRDREAFELVRQLGDAADILADRDVLAATGEVESVLSDLVRETTLADLPRDRLVQLAAQASRRAACSSRLELYQQGLPAARALQHSHAVLTGTLRPDEVQARVRARYPAAEQLPDRPDLDALVAPLGLLFDASEGAYTRRGDAYRSSFQTIVASSGRRTTTSHETTLTNTPAALQDREFAERLRVALRRRESLILAVSPLRADEAAAALARALSIEPLALDARLIAAIDAIASAHRIDPTVLDETDLAGPDGPEWHLLRQLAEQAATTLADTLLPARTPLLLVRPGPLARYALTDLVHRLVQSTRDPEAAPVFLLIPSTLPFLIDDQLPVPGFLPAQRLKVPEPWLDARRRERTAPV